MKNNQLLQITKEISLNPEVLVDLKWEESNKSHFLQKLLDFSQYHRTTFFDYQMNDKVINLLFKKLNDLRFPGEYNMPTKDLQNITEWINKNKEVANAPEKINIKKQQYNANRVEEVVERLTNFDLEKEINLIKDKIEFCNKKALEDKWHKDKLTYELKEAIKNQTFSEEDFDCLKKEGFLNTSYDFGRFKEEFNIKNELSFLFSKNTYAGLVIGCGHDNIPSEITYELGLPNEVSGECKHDHQKDLCVTLDPSGCVLHADITGVDAKDKEFWHLLKDNLSNIKLERIVDATFCNITQDKEILSLMFDCGHKVFDQNDQEVVGDVN